MNDAPDRMPLTSMNVTTARLERLAELFPEARTDGGIDFGKLRQALGEIVDESRERYGLTWSGKADATRAVQIPSTGTLRPLRDESVAFDETTNIMVEGENLEVLKLLQKAYHGRIKMIYIDPPYNTGQEFIYPDNFREGLHDYLRYSGQVDDEGYQLTSATETSGRYHSKWLSMMYPRLFLARNLLREDGVIFVSIADHEVHNLRHLLDEIFGPDNFIASVIWQKVYSPKGTARHFSDDHDYVLVYARNATAWTPELLPRTEEMNARYSNPDDDSRGSWKPGGLDARNYYSKGTYSITCPSGRVIDGPPPGSYWRIAEDKFKALDADGRIWWGEEGNNVPAIKRYLSEVRQGRVPQTLWTYQEVGHNQEAKKELLNRVTFDSSDSVFDTPKPTRLIQQMLRIGTRPDQGDIVLDFFAGSGSTGDAVMQLNAEDGGNRQFILVQLPEKTGFDDYPSIAEITKTRLKAASDAVRETVDGQLDLEGKGKPDLGYRTFSLTSSNFKIWEPPAGDAEDLEEQLRLYADNLVPDAPKEAILYELLLKAGLQLASPVEKLELAGAEVFSIAAGTLLVCLEDPIKVEALRAMMAKKPHMVLCLDHALQGNDKLLTNTVLEMKSHGIEHFRTV